VEFELAEEHRMLKDLVRRFVADELMPLEAQVMRNEAEGRGTSIGAAEQARLDARARELGLFGLDAPEDVGGADLPMLAMVGVEEEMGRCITPYTLPPDSPNLRMLMATVDARQREAYLAPYVAGRTTSAIGISEPGAGSDPAGMTTHAVRDGADWVINGRKIWITRAAEADFTILMAVTDRQKGARGGISAFLVDRDTPGFNILRRIPMLGGQYSYEIALEDCRVEGWKLLGREGEGFAPMQVRLGTRRIQMAAWAGSLSLVNAGVKIWAKRFYSILYAGAVNLPQGIESCFAYGFQYGYAFPLRAAGAGSARKRIDVDAGYLYLDNSTVFRHQEGTPDRHVLSVRGGLAIELSPRVSLIGGAGLGYRIDYGASFSSGTFCSNAQ